MGREIQTLASLKGAIKCQVSVRNPRKFWCCLEQGFLKLSLMILFHLRNRYATLSIQRCKLSSEIKHILLINYKETGLRTRANIPQHVRGGHRAAVRSLCSPPLCVLGAELKSSGLAASSFFFFFNLFCRWQTYNFTFYYFMLKSICILMRPLHLII